MESIIKMVYLYGLTGVILIISAIFSARDKSNPKRFTSALFWGGYGLIMLPDFLSPIATGSIIVAMTALAGFGGVVAGKPIMPSNLISRAKKLGNKLFIPALVIPAVTIICATLLKDVSLGNIRLFPHKGATLAGLAMACIMALAIACLITKETPLESVRQSRRLLESMGWAVLLPQLLAVLGIIFTDAGVGVAISHLTNEYLAINNKLISVIAYCASMAIFTIIMGNAFAAFPVITAGIGIPILILEHGANPAIVCAVGMFSGYCGTLMTPMAANFNIIPAALLELKDKNAVIKAQINTALPLLLCNIALMYFLAFRF